MRDGYSRALDIERKARTLVAWCNEFVTDVRDCRDNSLVHSGEWVEVLGDLEAALEPLAEAEERDQSLKSFETLQKGDEIEVDIRRLFMSAHDWAPAVFMRWLTSFPSEGAYCRGVVNKMEVQMNVGKRIPPNLTRVDEGTFMVHSVDARCLRPLPRIKGEES